MERARAASVWYAGQWAAAARRQWVLRSAGVEGHAVAASVSHTLVACKDHVLAAGQNAAGELGGMPDATRWHTRRIEGAVQHVAAGSNFSWIGNSERMLACGTHNRGQLGALRADGALAHADAPRVSEIAAGLDHVVVRSGSEVWTCGRTYLFSPSQHRRPARTLRRRAIRFAYAPRRPPGRGARGKRARGRRHVARAHGKWAHVCLGQHRVRPGPMRLGRSAPDTDRGAVRYTPCGRAPRRQLRGAS